ncbi:hypothetical protein Sjap_001370 [Stephania japonica]|uniref:RING-type E3 ubiquitin transferase n=1 Tax=Stephania japonica TaxID=461633 RepID=A0AAP0KKR1_9MAGN
MADVDQYLDFSEEEEEEEEEVEEEEVYEDNFVPPRRTSSRNVARRVVFTEPELEEGEGEGEGEACGPSDGGAEREGVCCPICMEPWSSGDNHQISSLLCGHVYGLSCIEKWIRQCKKNNATCPQCGRKCKEKDIIKLYVSQISVADSDQQKKFLSLQSENEFLKTKIADLNEKIDQNRVERMSRAEVGIVPLEEEQRPQSATWVADSLRQTQHGQFFGSSSGRQGSSHCYFVLEDELVVDGARVFDMDADGKILILARRLPGMGGTHLLTKISLMYPYDSQNIPLPPSIKAVKDLHVSPCSGRLALFASLGKKLSVLSLESNNIVLSYDLPVPAWSCSWDKSSSYHIYAGSQSGMVLVFDMRQTASPLESISGLTCRPVHTIHSLVHNPCLPSGVKTILTASAIGPCVWKTGGVGERPFLIPEVANEGVCISLAYCPSSNDVVASYRPPVRTVADIVGTQLPLSQSPSPSVLGQGVRGSHVAIKRANDGCYRKSGSTSANVNDVRMSKSAIVTLGNHNPLFAYGDEISHGLSLSELPSLRVIQNLKPHEHPILDVKYCSSQGTGLLGCVSEDRLQLFRVNPS